LLQTLQKRAADGARALQRLRIGKSFFHFGDGAARNSVGINEGNNTNGQVQSWPLIPLEAGCFGDGAIRHNLRRSVLQTSAACGSSPFKQRYHGTQIADKFPYNLRHHR
jgi:hypothetical protein